jgi:hypothetical protein
LRAAFVQAGYPLGPAMLSREFNLRYWGKSISLQAMRKWLNGEAIPAQDKLLTLAEWLKIQPQILRYGSAAEMALKQQEKLWWESATYKERELFEQVLALPPEQRRVIQEVVTAFVIAYGNKGE